MRPNENKLLQLLSNNNVTFYIPPYQRNYEWDKEQCEVFFEDIIKTVEENKSHNHSEHFFGSVTYFQESTAFGQPNKLILIDGQQRITTSMLFLVAIRDICNDDGVKRLIDCSYLKNNNVQSNNDEYKVKLKQVETDWDAYKNIILGYSLSDKEKGSAVYKNYSYFCNQLSNLQKEKNIDIIELVEFGLSKFSVITIELEPQHNKWENPQEIFESMNSLGKPLSLADLVRNYLLLGLDPETQERLYSNYWVNMENKLGSEISNFIRDYMQVTQKRSYPKATNTNHKTLYKMFKDIYKDIDSETLLKSLNLYATYYSYIATGVSTGNGRIDKCLSDIRIINVTTAYSFLMTLFNSNYNGKINDTELSELFDVLIVYFLRRRMIYGLTSAENKSLPALSRAIGKIESSDNKKETMFDILSSQENMQRLPNDVELSRVLETMNFYNYRLCKFMLAKVEEKLTRSRPDLNDSLLQIEHIMPQTLKDSWNSYLGDNAKEIHSELVHTIGNLTLIRHNQELGQKSFDDKKVVYNNNAGLQIARTNIINNAKWSKDEIQKRTKWLTSFILNDVLPIPDRMRKTNNFHSDGNRLSFIALQLIGYEINFIADKSIKAKVVGDTEVEYNGKVWKLSPLTKELYAKSGKANKSGSYRGAAHWEFDGMKLEEII